MPSSQLAEQEVHISLLKEDLDKEHQRWQTSQKNYERQVLQLNYPRIYFDFIKEVCASCLNQLMEGVTELNQKLVYGETYLYY